jgi:hypothetical protein
VLMRLLGTVYVDFNILYNYCSFILNLSKMKEKVRVNMTVQQVFRCFKEKSMINFGKKCCRIFSIHSVY